MSHLLAEINELKQMIAHYEEYIAELEEAYAYIEERYHVIEEKVYNADTAYDMTNGDEWRGFLEKEAEELRNAMTSYTSDSQEETQHFLAEILVMIENIRELIKECQEKLACMEAELCIQSE
ncbi:MAG: DUF5082 domain-containing protein [Butyrivibrio sp.]|uniref:Uncharacterized protein n=1 Tax=Butyrivibrio hungatei TaxID=185008 RepID=A0A1D9P3U6_9FIRM|nr:MULTISPECIES: DUF5082 family protein [Butyrivibrio]AOZ97286.1 hypothetical protein bhn_I2253 [Butyrivibrio hungatei]MBE5840021.1 DUF5082 domain-containing protein [Butyrivibrio sp.]